MFRPAPFQAGPMLALLSLGYAASYLLLLAKLGPSAVALATIAVVGVAALISGMAGFAFSAICGAMLFQFRHDSVGTIETLMACSIANQTLSVWLLRRDIRLGAFGPFVVGGFIGVPIGVEALLKLDMQLFALAFGAALAVYGTYMLVRPPISFLPSARADVVVGFLGGLTATPGAIVSIACVARGWDKIRQRAVSSRTFC